MRAFAGGTSLSINAPLLVPAMARRSSSFPLQSAADTQVLSGSHTGSAVQDKAFEPTALQTAQSMVPYIPRLGRSSSGIASQRLLPTACSGLPFNNLSVLQEGMRFRDGHIWLHQRHE